MSQIAKKHLLAGIIFGDTKTQEYIYLPGGEVGTESPAAAFFICLFLLGHKVGDNHQHCHDS